MTLSGAAIPWHVDKLLNGIIKIKDGNSMTSKHFTFKGSAAQGPAIDLVTMSGLKFTAEERERLWRQIDPRTFLVEHLNVDETICEAPDSDGQSHNTQFIYSYHSEEGFIFALRNGLLALLREGETIRNSEAQMPNHKLKRNLLAVGQGCFVTYYNLFADRNASCEAVVNTLHNETGYTEQSCTSRAVKARRILDAGRGVDALRLIVSSPGSRLPPEIREAAESLLNGQSDVCAQVLSRPNHSQIRTKPEQAPH